MLSYALGSSELAQIMIEAGADVNAVDTYELFTYFIASALLICELPEPTAGIRVQPCLQLPQMPRI